MLRGKRVIVTGASSGIGEQMAYHLARMEAHLLLTARTEAKLQKVNGEQGVLGRMGISTPAPAHGHTWRPADPPQGLPSSGPSWPRTGAAGTGVVERCLELGAASARYISGSMDSPSLPEEVLREAENAWGRCCGAAPSPRAQPSLGGAGSEVSGKPPLPPGGLDMLILNHIGQSSFTFFSGDVGHVRKLMETNFVSYVALATAALPLLKESEGSIVVVSSIAGELLTQPFLCLPQVPAETPLPKAEEGPQAELGLRASMTAYSNTLNPNTGRARGGRVVQLVPAQHLRPSTVSLLSSLRQELIVDKVNVSITLCILGYINTESAVRAVSHVIPDTPAPKEECALEIIRAGALRRRELHYPAPAVSSMLLLRSLAPELLDSLVRSRYRLENVRRT
uniref:Uncharacterized protein n=1 Tax=Chloebia gouldiae TaxID=44316 RepID=A0A3L8QBB1_CHLGU|nr:hypothetical protein DV515_00017488 [Chloebia gouldiae]